MAKTKETTDAALEKDPEPQLADPPLVSAEEIAALQAQVADLQLRLAALGAQMSPADLMLKRASEAMGRLEARKRSRGRYQWRAENHAYRPTGHRREETPPTTWKFYSDARTPEEAEKDFRMNTGVQVDTDRRGAFRFVPDDPQLDPALAGPPTSLNRN